MERTKMCLTGRKLHSGRIYSIFDSIIGDYYGQNINILKYIKEVISIFPTQADDAPLVW